jgi:exodeoxyribonuclease V beta subunit
MKSFEFDILDSPLVGTNLIEASAGTGKTYTITGLFLRLVIEKKLTVDEILVVTFTEAATEELRDRIRSTLRKAEQVLSGEKSDDDFLEKIAQEYSSTKQSLSLLKDAIRDFDQASIFTIHGFCKRMLDENAFESGSLFDTELVTDHENLKKEIVQDFWRKYIYHESPLFVKFALANKFTPDNLLKLVGNRIMHPDFKIIPQVEIQDSIQGSFDEPGNGVIGIEEQEFKQSFLELRAAWQSARHEVENILLNKESLSRSRYRKENIPFWIDLMDQWLTSDGNDAMLFDKFEKFSSSEIVSATKKNSPVPQHSFFDLCENLKIKQEQLLKKFAQRLLALKVKLFDYIQDELDKRKTEKNIQSFDDLLLKLYYALQSPGGNDLADVISKKFKAALIDEFQDTDPVQYAIFNNIFNHKDNILFLIGDPKQAIYGFRGADIFAYMDAAERVMSRYTLGQNWRAEPDLINAINTIFTNAEPPFVFRQILYEPARAADKQDRKYLKINETMESPLQLWYLDANQFAEGDKAISKTDARELIYQTVAAEISRLLNLSQSGKVMIGERPLKEQDIAVLVRRNTEAIMMQRALFDLNIPAVLHSTNNLFDSFEAMEVQRVLVAIAEPNNDSLLKAALSTDMLGITGEQIEALIENDSAWESWLVNFRNYHDLWNRRGFFQMFRLFLSEKNVLPRLMAFPDGERRSTNVLHLAEVLQQTAMEKNPGMTELLKWLAEQRDSCTPRLEEHQLRLESDENAVKLVTVHKSKGLEYSIVFCPFTWDGSKIKRSEDFLVFHDENNDRIITLDLSSENIETNRIQAEKELLAENLRLLYVALTRARHRCYLVWGRINEAESSAPAYLLHQTTEVSPDSLIAGICSKFKAMTDSNLFSDLESIVNRADGSIRLSRTGLDLGQKYTPYLTDNEKLAFRPFRQKIDTSWQISSYSSMISRISYAAELADYDFVGDIKESDQSINLEKGIPKPFSGIISFPTGTKAGIFFHKIFELIDFEFHDRSMMIELIETKLKEYGFDPNWQLDVYEMVRKVLSLPLESGKEDFTLSKISNQQRLNELEFYFPLKKISPQKIKDIFKKYARPEFLDHFPQQMERLSFAPLRGFMKGFIDLVFQHDNRFYLVDWKSNFLGEQITDYGPDHLKMVMEKDFYFLQYHIYIIALNQYLSSRMPGYSYDRNFGGVCYLFLRGVDPEIGQDYGIFRDRPSLELIEELSDQLIERL